MISVLQLGTVDYATGLQLQRRLVDLRKNAQIGDVLLLLEHELVITLGRNARAKNILASPELLAQRGVEVFECDRGGDVTFHGPGQIVGYPILDLRGFPGTDGKRKTIGAVEFVRRLEEVLIRTCADFGIAGQRICGLTGVWTKREGHDFSRSEMRAQEGAALAAGEADSLEREGHDFSRAEMQTKQTAALAAEAANSFEREGHDLSRAEMQTKQTAALAAEAANSFEREGHDFSRAEMRTKQTAASAAEVTKIAALGVHISRGVTSHGFALNVSTDLSYFDLIVPCGIESKRVTSMQKELGHAPDPQEAAHSLSRNFGVVFASQILWLESLDDLLGNKVGVPMQPPAELRKIHGEEDTTWA